MPWRIIILQLPIRAALDGFGTAERVDSTGLVADVQLIDPLEGGEALIGIGEIEGDGAVVASFTGDDIEVSGAALENEAAGLRGAPDVENGVVEFPSENRGDLGDFGEAAVWIREWRRRSRSQ